MVGSDGRRFPASFGIEEWLTSGAERYEALLRPTRPGTYPIRVEFFHYITGKSLGAVTGNLVVHGADVTPPPPVLPPAETPAGPVVVAPPPIPEPGLGVTGPTAVSSRVPVSHPAASAPEDEPAAHHPATKATPRKRSCATKPKKQRSKCVKKRKKAPAGKVGPTRRKRRKGAAKGR
jgi:hypothetical protein